MQSLGEYVLCLTAAALISSILLSLFPEGTVQKLLRLICGVFLAVTALAPLPGLDLPDVTIFRENYLTGEDLAAQGEALAEESIHLRIKEAMEAYILDKAAALDMVLQPQIKLDAQGLPAEVTLRGSWTETACQGLSAIITKDLGIPEEDQQWEQENGQREQGNGLESTGGQP